MGWAIMSAGMLSAVAFYIVFWKLGIERVCGYDVYVDVTATIVLMLMFAGTYTGMIAAVIAGLLLSVALSITKKMRGYEKLERTGYFTWKWRYYPFEAAE